MNSREITFKDCPLTALSKQTVKKLSNLLNTNKILHSPTGYERDWRGLATLAEQRSICDELVMHRDNPVAKVLELWCEHKPDTATFENLQNFLGLIDRWHVIEDIEEDLQQDYRNYQMSIMNVSVSYANNTNTTVATIPLNSINNQVEVAAASFNDNVESNRKYDSDTKLLTSNDVKRSLQGLPLQQYDAFVLYADADFNYALEILNNLSHNSEYNLNFCLKDDLLFGILFEHVALMELIKERCSFVIVIITREFNKSPENKFLVNYAQALQIQTTNRKIIPLLYELNVDVPANLLTYSRMYYNSNRNFYYWSRLADSIQTLSTVSNNSKSASIRYTTETLLEPPSAPVLRNNNMVMGELRQPPYNPSFRESSSSSSNSSSKIHPRELVKECERLSKVQTNFYPNESSRIVGSTLSSSPNSRNEYQSNLYPTRDTSSNSIRNSCTASEDLDTVSSKQRNTNQNPNPALYNSSTTEEEASPTSERMDRTKRGTRKLWKKLFKR